MAKNDLKIRGVTVGRPRLAAVAAEKGPPRLEIAVEVENKTGAPRYAWATPQHYEYDPSSRVLTVHMAEKPLELPPGLIMISDHPRVPQQVEVAPNGHAQIQVRIPPFIRRPAPEGGWFEDPIGEIDRVDVTIQHAPERAAPVKPHETGADVRARLMKQGEVVKATIETSRRRGATT